MRTLAASSWPPAFASAKARRLIATKAFRTKGGPVTVKVRPTKRARRALKKKGRLKLRLQVDFKPTGGTTTTKRATVTIDAGADQLPASCASTARCTFPWMWSAPMRSTTPSREQHVHAAA